MLKSSVVELKQSDSSDPGRLFERKLKTGSRQEDQYKRQQLARQAQASDLTEAIWNQSKNFHDSG